MTTQKTITEIPTKVYFDSLHSKIERSRRDLGLDFSDESGDSVKRDQDKKFKGNKLTNIYSITVNRNPTLDNKVLNEKLNDDELDNSFFLRYNPTLENYFQVSVGKDTNILINYDKIQVTDTSKIKAPDSGGYLLQQWKIESNEENNTGKIQNLFKSTESNCSTGKSGANSVPPVCSSLMYNETSSGNFSVIVFCSFERTDIIHFTNITFHYNRFSFLTIDSIKSRGRFRIQFLLEDGTWSTRYKILKNDRYSDSSTDWTLVSLNFTIEIDG